MSFAFRSLLHLMALLPLPWAHRLGALSGWLSRVLPHNYRQVMERNLDICLPELSGQARQQFSAAAYREMGKTIWEMGAVWTWPQDKILKTIQHVRGENLLTQAFDEGRGVILAVPHLGCWEVLGVYCSSHYNMTSMYRPPRILALDHMVKSARQRMGSNLVPANTQGIKLLLQALKRNELVAILPDQDPRNDGNVFADFFAYRASTPTLLPRLANKTGATVIFGYAERLRNGQGYNIQFVSADPMIHDNDPIIAATAMNRDIEKCIRAIPEQYQWTYKRFKTRPPGEAKFY